MPCVLLVYTGPYIRQIKYTVMMNKNCRFYDIWTGVLMLGHDHISHYSKYALSSTLSIYSTLIANVFRYYNAVFLWDCWFLLILWRDRWYANMNPLDKKSLQSLILRWPLTPVGLLLSLVGEDFDHFWQNIWLLWLMDDGLVR